MYMFHVVLCIAHIYKINIYSYLTLLLTTILNIQIFPKNLSSKIIKLFIYIYI